MHMALVELNGSQSKTKCNQFDKGTGKNGQEASKCGE